MPRKSGSVGDLGGRPPRSTRPLEGGVLASFRLTFRGRDRQRVSAVIGFP
jgi:hypothetical protein